MSSEWGFALLAPWGRDTLVGCAALTLALAVAFGFVRRSRRRVITSALAATAITVLIMTCLQPCLIRKHPRLVPARAIVLIDDSMSMERSTDTSVRESRMARAQRFLGALRGSAPVDLSIATLSGRNPSEPWSATHDRTSLFDRCGELARTAPRPDAIFLLSDGDSNDDDCDPIETAERIRALGVPAFALACASAPVDDIRLVAAHVPERTRAGRWLRAQCMIGQRGCRGRTVTLRVVEGLRTVATKSVTLTRPVEVVDVRWFVERRGQHSWRIEIDGPADAIPGNEVTHVKTVAVSLDLRILLVSEYPSWDFRMVQTALQDQRRRRGIDAVESLLTGSSSTPLPALEEFDQVIVFGPCPAQVQRRPEALAEFVRHGGSVCFVGSPALRSSQLRRLLPVRADPSNDRLGARALVRSDSNSPSGSPIMPRANASLPWIRRVYGAVARDDAELLAFATPTSGGAATPLIGYRRFDAGRCLWIGTDELWRMRAQLDREAARRSAAQWVEFLALRARRELEESTLRVDRAFAHVGDVVTIHGTPESRIDVVGPSQPATTIELSEQLGESGYGQATWRPAAPGVFLIRDRLGSRSSKVVVEDGSVETLLDAPDAKMLDAFCRTSGGSLVDSETMERVFDRGWARPRHHVRHDRLDLESVFALAAAVLAWFAMASAGVGSPMSGRIRDGGV